MGTTTLCKLCLKEKMLVDSHIIPKFVGRWLKDTSATGYIRQAINPNMRIQDLPTLKLLCRDCEGILAKWEREFSQTIFIPYLNEKKQKFRYSEWLIKFIISISYRVAITEVESFREESPKLATELDRAVENWRNVLLNDHPSHKYAHHLFFLDTIKAAKGSNIPEGFHWYSLRGVDATIVSNSNSVFVFSKFPGMFFFSGVYPEKPNGWQKTRVHDEGRIVAANQIVSLPGFGDFFTDRIRQTMAFARGISDKQEQKIMTDILKDPKRTVNSDTFRVQQIESYWQKENNDQEKDG